MESRVTDTAKADEESAEWLENDIQALLLIVTTHAEKILNERATRFQEKITSILERIPEPGFLNDEATKDLIARLRQDLNTAVQLLQTEYKIALFESLGELKQWKAGMENSIRSGNINQNLLKMTFITKANMKMKTEAKGIAISTMKASKITTGKNTHHLIQGATVRLILEESTIDAGEDINITVIATG